MLDLDDLLSIVEYSYDGAGEEELIECLAYSPAKQHYGISYDPREQDLIRENLASEKAPKVSLNLGSLAALPTELLYLVSLNLDIASLFKFRHVSRGTKWIVESLREYEIVVTYGLDAMRAILQTEMTAHHTIRDMFDALAIQNCTCCGHFATHIFLLSLTKYCFDCILSLPSLRLVSLDEASALFMVPSEKLRASSPWMRTRRSGISKTRMDVLTVEDAVKSAIKLYGDTSDIESAQENLHKFYRTYTALECATTLPHRHLTTGNIDNGLRCVGCESVYSNIDPVGLCDLDPEVITFLHRWYSREQFLNHIKTCEGAQEEWELEKVAFRTE